MPRGNTLATDFTTIAQTAEADSKDYAFVRQSATRVLLLLHMDNHTTKAKRSFNLSFSLRDKGRSKSTPRSHMKRTIQLAEAKQKDLHGPTLVEVTILHMSIYIECV
jgi:hypothetical protein